ncbi:SURF1 family protein [Pelagibacteraceae bacterium]|nr:SURF1 family protein [Pelagibacteraceae bacterium]MDC0366034.1 SURF1 family protein [Pelagibacteraceae bacterium]
MKNLLLFKIFVFLFITLFCTLGTWQLYRLQWKQDVINQISEGLKSTPIKYSQDIRKNYQKVTLVGEYDFKSQIYLYSLNDKGQPGFDVVTPFETTKKENVLVNRGWIKKELKNHSDINILSNNVTGMLRQANRKNFFTPDNDINKNIWFSVNLEDVQKITGKKFNEFIVYLDDKNINVPKPKKITVDLPNNHLKYALTWYSISISILFYYLYFRKKT